MNFAYAHGQAVTCVIAVDKNMCSRDAVQNVNICRCGNKTILITSISIKNM